MKISREGVHRQGILASLAVESMQSFKYLRATGRFAVIRAAFADAVRASRNVDDRASVVDQIGLSMREPLLVVWLVGVFYLFVFVLRQGLGVITDGILFFYRVSIELSILEGQLQEFAANVGSIDAYEQLRAELNEAAEPEDGSEPFSFEREIRLDGISFAYRGLHVLRELEITIPKRKTVALVGASGAGKSTIVDLVAACLEPTEGAVRVDGVDLRDVQRAAYRAALGYVTQESVVFSGSVLRNVTMRWDREPTAKEIERAREAARLANCLQVIEGLEEGWETELGERGVRLSGGERQRVAIARELYQDLQLLILDEATSSLDSISEQAVQRSLQLLHGKLTLLIVSHRLSTIRHADVVYVIEGGRVTESGTFDELAQRRDSRFRQLCEMQSLV
jgi:ABC-type multidrug transport system fused ATPase/permease subunit